MKKKKHKNDVYVTFQQNEKFVLNNDFFKTKICHSIDLRNSKYVHEYITKNMEIDQTNVEAYIFKKFFLEKIGGEKLIKPYFLRNYVNENYNKDVKLKTFYDNIKKMIFFLKDLLLFTKPNKPIFTHRYKNNGKLIIFLSESII